MTEYFKLLTDKKQYSIWAHPRSGSTWLCNIFNGFALKNFTESDYYLVTPSEFLLRAPTERLYTEWDANKKRNIYAVWKVISPYNEYRIDLNDILLHTTPIAIGRKNWKHSVMSWIKADQTGVWNTANINKMPEVDIELVTEEKIYHIMRLMSDWYYKIKELSLPVIWYEDLSFTIRDLEIYGFDTTEFSDFYDENLIKKSY